MHRTRFASRRVTQAALWLAGVLLLALTAVGVAGVAATHRAMTRELAMQVDAATAIFVEIHQEGGRDALAVAIAELSDRRSPSLFVAGLYTLDGAKLAGPFDAAPPSRTWHRHELTLSGPVSGPVSGRPESFYVRATDLADAQLFVGRSTRLMDRMIAALVGSMGVLWAVMAAGLGLVGIAANRILADEIERLESVLDRYAGGDHAARVNLPRPPRDRIERTGQMIDGHLDRLTRSFQTIRNTAAAIAHDLRIPLSRASLQIQSLARDPDLPEQASHRAREATGEIERLSGILSAILRIAETQGNTGAGFEAFDLSRLVAEIAESFAPVFEDGGRRLICEIRDPGICIRGDRGMVTQALVNLLGNVIAHCPQDTTARLSLARCVGQDTARVSVSDDGPGVPGHLMDRIFAPFSRLDPDRRDGGSGLGLALVSAVAEAHGAEIEVRRDAPGLSVSLRFAASASCNRDPGGSDHLTEL